MKHTLKLALIVLVASCSNGTEKKKAELLKLIEDQKDSAEVYANEIKKIDDSVRIYNNEMSRRVDLKNTSREFKLATLKNLTSVEHVYRKGRRFDNELGIARCRDKIDSLKFEIIKLK